MSEDKMSAQQQTNDTESVTHCEVGRTTEEPEIKTVEVFFKVVFMKVGDIDTINERFAAEVFMQARWRAPQFDGKSVSIAVDWSKQWNPAIVIENCISQTRNDKWKIVRKDANGQAYVVEKRRLKGEFSENLELQHFPFDTQDLSLLITTKLSEDEVTFVEDDKEMSYVNSAAFSDVQKWHLYNHVEFQQNVSTQEYTNVKFKHPGVFAMARASRKAGFFIWNILLVMALISTLSFATFAVDNNLPQNRLQLSFTLVLTAVTFKFVVTQSLPKLSYLTYLDVHVIGSMMTLYLICGWHAIVKFIAIANVTYGYALDVFAFVFFICIYAIFNIIFVARIVHWGLRRAREMEEKDKRHMVRLEQSTRPVVVLKH